jgi:hypothetical protein
MTPATKLRIIFSFKIKITPQKTFPRLSDETISPGKKLGDQFKILKWLMLLIFQITKVLFKQCAMAMMEGRYFTDGEKSK